MKLMLLEPYFTGSHKNWAEEFKKFSSHDIEILSLNGSYWKWRMHGGAVTLARKFMKGSYNPDLILATDMLDLTTFLSLARTRTANTPVAIYFHENQLTYPWSPTDRDVQNKRDNHYCFINYASALAADHVLFNSDFHKTSFLEALKKFLKHFPDNNELASVDMIEKKSEVLHLGLDLAEFDRLKPEDKNRTDRATILWNHRWEYDKNPDDFFDALYQLDEHGVDFRLVLLGENFSQQPGVFEKARAHFHEKILHYGFAETKDDYMKWLWRSDILPVTSNQDFFGISVVEAMYCNCFPLLPKRLAFPEHIPQQFQDTFFYSSQSDLVKRLQGLIFNVKVIRKQNIRQYIEKYDWARMISVYDQRFEQQANARFEL